MIRRLERVSEERNGQKSVRNIVWIYMVERDIRGQFKDIPVGCRSQCHRGGARRLRGDGEAGAIRRRNCRCARDLAEARAKRSGAVEGHTFEVPQRLGRIVKRCTLEPFYICLGGCQNEEQRRGGAGD